MENLIVTEQEPAGASIFCEVRIEDKWGSLTYGSQMYFVCNQEKKISQYFPWMKEQKYKRKLEKLGYKF